jgi:hypothetical protein
MAKEKQEERRSKRKTEAEGRVTSARKNVATSSSRPGKYFFFSSRFTEESLNYCSFLLVCLFPSATERINNHLFPQQFL